MLTLIQIAAVVLAVLLVLMVARLTRTRGDRTERQLPLPAEAGGRGPMRPHDVPIEHPARERPLAAEAVSPRALATLVVPAPVPTGAGTASGSPATAWTASWDGRRSGGGVLDGARAYGARPAHPPAGTDVELQDLAAHLRDRATALEAESRVQRNEIGRLRAALAEAVRELEALRTHRVEVEGRPAPEPKLPNVNVYELRTARRT